jgi:hypothetical protein
MLKLAWQANRMQELFVRDVIFTSTDSSKDQIVNGQIDTLCQTELPIMSRRALRELGRESEMSTDFWSPECFAVGGQRVEFAGIVRDMQLRLKGTAKSVRTHVLIVEALDHVADFIFNAGFVQKYFDLIFDKVKSFFGGIFSWKRKQTKREFF